MKNIKTIHGNRRGSVRYEHDIKVGSVMKMNRNGKTVYVTVVDDGLAGMPEVQFDNGVTILVDPHELVECAQ